MKNQIRLSTRIGRVAACLALLNIAVPGSALVVFGVPVREKVDESLAQVAAKRKDLANRRAKSASRLLTSTEEHKLQGKLGENPYLAGQNKWDIVYKGINLMSGNYSTSATDMSFDGGYGIPVNVTRSYSSNNADEGPFGKGWSLSADVRSTAGGLLKSAGAPVRAVPTMMKERPTLQDDPNVAVEPAQAIIMTDAAGLEETVQKDVDGILTTPPWDKNTSDSVYEWVTLGGNKYQVLLSNTVTTPEGTKYTYAKKGSYPYGTVPWNNSSATPEAANIMKVTSATDRQGNVTTYLYGSGTVTFQKSNGTTVENPLTQVSMPGGHIITFAWGTTGAATGRVTSISDNSGARTVTYTYSGTAGHGLLANATTPGGKTTTYGYGSPVVPNGWSTDVATNLLTTITDPRGLTTVMTYKMTWQPLPQAGTTVLAPVCQRVKQPDGKTLYFCGMADGLYDSDWPESLGDGQAGVTQQWEEWSGGVKLVYGAFMSWSESGMFIVRMYEPFGNASQRLGGNLGEFNYPTRSYTYYDIASQNLMSQMSYTDAYISGNSAYLSPDLSISRGLRTSSGSADQTTKVDSATTYNFMGQPLSKVNHEYTYSGSGGAGNWVQSRSVTIGYAYWGADKYYQQKAIKDQAGRYSYTDYYNSNATAGKRGQIFRTYDPKNASFYLDTSIAPPAATASANYWKYQLNPSSATAYSAQFDYDVQGRPIDIWKLQKTTTSPWTYARTHNTYGSDGSPVWGQASSVVEDYGGIGRTTQNLAYTSWGKACDVVDPAGHEFVTSFDGDGVVQSISRTDVSPSVPVVTYAYGSTAGTVSYGQPTSATDGLSGVSQTISYVTSGAGIGQPSSVTETNGSDFYTTSYTYNGQGDRATSTYSTPSGTTRWGYADFVSTGSPTGPSRAFQTLRRLDSSGNPTGEEIHYAYDAGGRLRSSAFAQSPASGFTPTTGNPWYDATHPASVRARAWHAYDAGGRLVSLEHYWDTRSGSSYTSEAVLANQCDYELSGSNRGLKTTSRFYAKNPSVPSNFSLEHTETYGYDASLDYLTSANYGDGMANATPSWTYDAAGNRNDASVDNLNRASAIGGNTITNDILGNRLTKSGVTYTWDCLNRLAALSGGITASYKYRADGLRVAKSTGGVTTLYRHSGIMGFESVEIPSSGATVVTRNALGARGVDFVERTVGTTVTSVFPIYDGLGNMVANISRNGSGYSINDQRSFDAWGTIRRGATTGDPKGRYCASLGHEQDDETGLVYMRSRYYDPSSGRFISQDRTHDGSNWFIYCKNKPTSLTDASGDTAETSVWGMMGCLLALFAIATIDKNPLLALSAGCLAVVAFEQGLDSTGAFDMYDGGIMNGGRIAGFLCGTFGVIIATILAAAKAGIQTQAAAVVIQATLYGLVLIAALLSIDGNEHEDYHSGQPG